MLAWMIVAAAVVVLAALVWWTSGRAKRARDLQTRIGKTQGDVALKAGRHTGDQFHTGIGPGGSY